jgi:hypothetical protein
LMHAPQIAAVVAWNSFDSSRFTFEGVQWNGMATPLVCDSKGINNAPHLRSTRRGLEFRPRYGTATNQSSNRFANLGFTAFDQKRAIRFPSKHILFEDGPSVAFHICNVAIWVIANSFDTIFNRHPTRLYTCSITI